MSKYRSLPKEIKRGREYLVKSVPKALEEHPEREDVIRDSVEKTVLDWLDTIDGLLEEMAEVNRIYEEAREQIRITERAMKKIFLGISW